MGIERTQGEILAYYEGRRDSTRLWAWWKDGIQYVGSGVYTLDYALKELDKGEAEHLEKFLTKDR